MTRNNTFSATPRLLSLGLFLFTATAGWYALILLTNDVGDYCPDHEQLIGLGIAVVVAVGGWARRCATIKLR